MQDNSSTRPIENRGRVILLFLLFLLALYQFYTAGYSAFTMVCLLPAVFLCVYVGFKYRMSTFWALFFINYFIHILGKHSLLPPGVPTSLYNEMFEMLLLAIAIIDVRQMPHFERAGNLMLLALSVWCGFCTLEVLNDTCNLGINIGAWYTGARGMAFQLMYIFLVFTIYISDAVILKRYLYAWAAFAFFSVFWAWKQQYIGFTYPEEFWINNIGYVTHIINGGSLIRYFSTFSDAANYGCNAAATATAFVIFAITSRLNKERILWGVLAILVIWGMFSSGTRTAIACLGAGLASYVILSKSFKIAIPFSIMFAIVAILLVFTNIGNGNQQIRRMRSAFNKKDASSNVRTINQEAMKKYIRDAPWGIGLGMGQDNVPANNKFRKLATIAPDSEYVFIWQRTGPIGITVFLIANFIIFVGGARIVMFKIKNRSLMGIGAGFCCAFVAIHLGGYGNQVLLQYPNGLLFYGGMTIVYLLPFIEPEWNRIEEQQYAKQEERRRLKLEKKKASRV